MQRTIITAKEIKKYGMQVTMIPFIEPVTNELRYRIIGLCNKKQIKLAETSKPLQALSELNNFFLKFSKDFKNIGELTIKEFDKELVSLSNTENELNKKLDFINNIPTKEYLEKLPMRGEKSLISYCKLLGIKGYSSLKKPDLLNLIMDKYVEKIKES